MSKMEDTEKRRVRAQAVDEEYQKLEKFHVDRRRIFLVDDDHERSGGYGIVRRAELQHSTYLPAWLASRQYGPPQMVAVKQIKISAADNMPSVKRAFTKEMLVWSSLESHPGIAKFLGFYADFKRAEAWLLSPWEPNGNISEFIHAHDLEVPEKLSLVHDTIDALDFLHQLDPPVCHGDIKSANVLVSADFKARLCDFGLARVHEDSGFGRLETSTGFKGSIRWCSPEIINGGPRTPTSDVYSWAWLVWEIMTGKLPYDGTSVDYVIIRQIFESPLPQVDGQARLSECLQLWELMTRCWNADSVQRPTAAMCKTTVTYLPRCTPTPENADDQTRSATLLENLGVLESWKGNHVESFAYLDEALRLYREEGDTRGVAGVLRKQAAAAYRNSDDARAVAMATTALEHSRTLNDSLGIADASFWFGSTLYMQGQVDEALPLLQESLEIYRKHGHDVGAAQCLERIGEIQRFTAQYEKALSTLGDAVAVASGSGDRLGVAKALIIIGATHLIQADLVKAADTLSEASTIARNIGWDQGLSNSLRTMGTVKMRSANFREAQEYFQESISVARSKNARWTLARGLEELGGCFRAQLKFDEAAAALEEACLLYQEMSKHRHWERLASNLCQLKVIQGEWDKALFWYDHIIEVSRGRKEQWEIAGYLQEKGEILVKAERYDEAALHFEAAMATRRENGYSWGWELERLCAIPRTVMNWERRVALLCDVRKLQRRLPQFTTSILKLPIAISPAQP
ncbi:hypothetical protein M407DRAFT_26997 [Tulasnella calospora MUT 4182]|uniref:Protein kinase domain-containing protein n=1 Tax=Tulasnella calospora MUT 4182 TaxID=1051891 RepID=A0A0C3Q3Z2_9AGAM|nr:hypothetical protein M407DRAFT_26997 [Tulasnella calospora MUT 4182]